jgi:hypothetical protein
VYTAVVVAEVLGRAVAEKTEGEGERVSLLWVGGKEGEGGRDLESNPVAV